jgi:hypothetical protein
MKIDLYDVAMTMYVSLACVLITVNVMILIYILGN